MPAVHSIDYFVFTVPDLAEAEQFYTAFGLDVRRVGSRLELYTLGHAHRWGAVHESPGQAKRLQFLTFACYETDFAGLILQAESGNFSRCEPHRLGTPDGLWLRHPEGFPVQVIVADKSSPYQKSIPIVAPSAVLGAGAALNRAKTLQVRPRRLSHILLFSGDVPKSIAFYQDALGLRIADRSGDTIVFMHGVHGSDHHLIAMAKSEGPGMHHLSWDVANFDEVGKGMEQMRQAGHTRGWGVGRHILGSNYFHYVRDPWGSYCEYSFDIDFVPGGFAWPAADHPPQDALYVWGPTLPDDFIKNYEIASLLLDA
jgi:catechol 2,3-dioxygenase-like lactoylglutathione lyase family enzyme